MSKRVPSIVINDILYCIGHITSYTANLSLEDFTSNFMVIEACLYNNDSPHIPWNLIKGMRNRLIHEYFGTDLPVVWNVIKNDLPTFKSDLQLIYKNLTEQGR